MKAPRIANSGHPVSTSDIERVERALGVRLPDDYAAFLRATNGGTSEPERFGGAWGSTLLDFFLQIDGGEYDDLLAVNARLGVPKGLLAVASDAGGNYVCVAVDDARRGTVYFWPLDDNAGVPIKITETFAEFLSSFGDAPPEKPDDAHVPRLTPVAERRAELERGYALLREHDARQAREDAIVDALLAAGDASVALLSQSAAGAAHEESSLAFKRLRDKHAWLRRRRSASPTPSPIEDEAGFRAQDDALMRAMTDHHISEAGSVERIVELLNALAKARRALVSLGPGIAAESIASLDAAFNDARNWLEEMDNDAEDAEAET